MRGGGQNARFNVFELDAASNNSVDDIRSLIGQVRYPPMEGKYKVYIIDEVHMLSTQAFNAFLKTLEEPPSHVKFILATTEKHKVLPTILSRCQIYDFSRLDAPSIVEFLQKVASTEKIQVEMEALHVIGQHSDGSLREALTLLDMACNYVREGKVTRRQVLDQLHILDREFYFDLTHSFLQGDTTAALLAFQAILQDGFDAQFFVMGLEEHFRDLLLAVDPRAASLLHHSDVVNKRYREIAATIPKSHILSSLSILSRCDFLYSRSRNPRLHVELCLIRLCHLRDVLGTTDGAQPPADHRAEGTGPPKPPTDRELSELLEDFLQSELADFSRDEWIRNCRVSWSEGVGIRLSAPDPYFKKLNTYKGRLEERWGKYLVGENRKLDLVNIGPLVERPHGDQVFERMNEKNKNVGRLRDNIALMVDPITSLLLSQGEVTATKLKNQDIFSMTCSLMPENEKPPSWNRFCIVTMRV